MNKKNLFFNAVEHFSKCMTPVIPIILAGGLLKLFIVIFNLIGLLNSTTDTYRILMAFSDAPFYFLPIFVAYASARHFKTEPMYALAVIACLILPDFINIMNASENIYFIFVPIAKISYAYAVVPIVFIVYMLSYVEKFYEKNIPESVGTIVNPLLIILTSVLVCIFFIGPVSQIASDMLLKGFDYVYGRYPAAACGIIGLFLPLMISTGLHWVFMTMSITRLSMGGIDPFFMANCFNNSMALAGTAAGMLLTSKDAEEKKILLTSGITAFLPGVAEPMLFGICIPYKYPLAAVMAACGIACTFQGIVTINTYIYAFPGIISVMMFSDSNNPMNLVYALISALIAFLAAFVFIIILKRALEIKKK